MTFWKSFKAKACSIDLESSDKQGVLLEVLQAMVAGGALDRGLVEPAHAILLAREDLATTGVGQNVAIPHIQVDGLSRVAASLCVHRRGVEWGAVDGEPVQVLFTVLRPSLSGPLHDPAVHLEMMRWIARLGRDRDFRSFALQARSRSELYGLLKEMSGV